MRVSLRYIARAIRSKLNKNGGQQMPVSVRYIVDDVDTAIPFYTDMLDFKVDMHFGPDSPASREVTCACCSTSRAA